MDIFVGADVCTFVMCPTRTCSRAAAFILSFVSSDSTPFSLLTFGSPPQFLFVINIRLQSLPPFPIHSLLFLHPFATLKPELQDIAFAWAIAGAAGIILAGRKTAPLENTAERINQLSKTTKVLVHSVDITSEESVKRLIRKIADDFSRLDVVINNAGSLQDAKFGDIEPSRWWIDFVSSAEYMCLGLGY